MSNVDLILILMAILSVFISGYLYAERQNRKRWMIELERSRKISAALKRLLTESYASRVLILSAHNGGDLPSVVRPMYSTVLYEDSDPPLKPVISNWRDQLLDDEYKLMLQKLDSAKQLQLITEDLPEDSILRAIYEDQGIKESWLYYLNTTGKEYVYLSLNLIQNTEAFKFHTRNAARVAVNELQKLFREASRKKKFIFF